MGIKLYPHQAKAVKQLHNGAILNGGVGSGKSLTALAYFHCLNGGSLPSDDCPSEGFVPMNDPPLDLYIITTAAKRDKKEWGLELARFLMAEGEPGNHNGIYYHRVVVDSWNNIDKYIKIKNAFFIFDETKVRSWGLWSKSFVKIGLNNQWIMLTATPADKWEDYRAIFMANGFYINKTQFDEQHIVYNPHVPYPSIKSYINEGRLIRLRRSILVDMELDRKTIRHDIDCICSYDEEMYNDIVYNKWNYDENRPIRNSSEYCQYLRKCVNKSEDKIVRVHEIFDEHPKLIIFYNYSYELLDLLAAFEFMKDDESPESFAIAEWNGRAHQDIPDTDKWVYLVQYTAGCEGWNCIKTDTIVFFSENYSYSVMEQAKGRIDRLNNVFIDLYYYHLITNSSIDIGIRRTLKNKKKFNEGQFGRFSKGE